MDEPQHPEPKVPSKTRQVFGFSLSFLVSIALTVLAVPLLFNAVCMPMTDGRPTGYFGLALLRPDWVFALYVLLAVAGGLTIVVRTRNRGVRWGCATAVVLLVIGLLIMFNH